MVDLRTRLAEHRAQEQKLNWSGTFTDYFALVHENPRIASLSHARIFQMIMSHGSYLDEQGQARYPFFEDEIMGIERPLSQIVDYFRSSAQRLEVRKRILLLVGPPGAGKSTVATLIKRGLEAYSRTDDGAAYTIFGCPMHEEPLHLIPDHMRHDIYNEHGIYIEGDLCPWCQHHVDAGPGEDHPWNLPNKPWDGTIESVPVHRVEFSEKRRLAIGTYQPSDPKSQDISELVGSIDLSTVGEVGSESDPRAYRFDGELNISNRGMCEFIEILKSDERFLYVLLSLSQEQNIKTGRYSMIYADECVIAHTNEYEYNAFIANKKSEALQDRIIMVHVPYNLRVDDEVKIYQKLLKQSAIRDTHIAPGTLETAAKFAVLTRLEPSKKADMSLVKKMKLYNGESVDQYGQYDVRELHEEAEREGMDGISPRYVINRLSSALVRDDVPCMNAIDALRSLRDGLEQHTAISAEQRTEYEQFIAEARKEYDEEAKVEIQKAFVYAFEESARTLLDNYLGNVEAFCNKAKVKDPITEEEVEPDEELMTSIEQQIGVNDSGKKGFREEIMIRVASLARRGEQFTYESHDRLREAIEKKLFTDLKNVVKITTSPTPDDEEQKRINDVADRLIAHHDYCPHCAHELMKYVGTLLKR